MPTLCLLDCKSSSAVRKFTLLLKAYFLELYGWSIAI